MLIQSHFIHYFISFTIRELGSQQQKAEEAGALRPLASRVGAQAPRALGKGWTGTFKETTKIDKQSPKRAISIPKTVKFKTFLPIAIFEYKISEILPI